MSIRHRLAGGELLAACASALLAAPSTAYASTIQTSGSLDEMPPYVRAMFIGVFILVPLTIGLAVWASLRKRKTDTAMVEDMLGEVRGIVESTGVPTSAGGATVIINGVPVIAQGQPVSPAGTPSPAGDLFAQIVADDPSFNEELFRGRVNEMFIAIKYAWAARDMEPVRRFLSDEQFAVADLKVKADYLAKGRINRLEDIVITRIAPFEVERQGEFDSVKVTIEGAVIPSTVEEKTGKLVNPGVMGDGKTRMRFREAWTFLRKAGVKSRMDATITKCPNCGAPVTAGGYETCAYCAAQLNDPALDWVVVGIEHFG